MQFKERRISEYEGYFSKFISSIEESVSKKVFYVLDLLKMQERVSEKFVKYIRDGLYELRVEYNGNIYRVFFCFDEGRLVILFNGFQKKSLKTPSSEIEKALKLKKEHYESKKLTSVDAIMDAKFGKVGTPEREAFRKEARAYCGENAFSDMPVLMQKRVKKVDSFLNIGYSGVMKTALLLGLTELEAKVVGKRQL